MSRVLVTGGAGTIGQPRWCDGCCGDPGLRDPRLRPARGAGLDARGRRGPRRRPARRRRGAARRSAAARTSSTWPDADGLVHARRRSTTRSARGAAIDEGVERFTYVSSSHGVRERRRVPRRPRSTCRAARRRGPRYGWSKLAGEVHCRAAHDEFGLPFTICRPFDAYGPWRAADRSPGRRADAHLRTSTTSPTAIVTATAASGRPERGLQHRGERGAHAGRDRAYLLGGVRQRLELELGSRASRPSVQRRWPSVEKAERLLGWRARIGVARGSSRRAMARRALITGITGQDGSYLAELLLDKGYEVHGMVRRSSTERFERVEHLRDRLTLHQGDLLDERSLVDTLRAARPDEVYNLAAMSFVAVSWIQPTLTGGVHRRRRDAAARGAARGLPGGALLPGLVERDVRQGPRDAADRGDAVLPALARTASPRSTATTSRSTTASRTGCTRAAASSSTTSPSAAGSSSSTRKLTWHAAAIKLGLAQELRLGNLDAAARLGLREGLRRGDVADAPAGPGGRLRDRHGRDGTRCASCAELAFDRVGLRADDHIVDRRVAQAARGGRRAGRRRRRRRRRVLGWEPKTSFDELIALMVDADLERLG